MTPAMELRRDREQWRVRNAAAVRKISKELNVNSSVVSEVLEGKRKTPTQQVERRLADLGCPGFGQYRTEER